tara:strand:+ start:95 stop:595 length:501 start_codon:yes stop_codon:yes gene_type:complete
MATTIEKFDSSGGFSVEKVVHIDELHNAKDLNSLQIRNSFYGDSSITQYVLRGLNTDVLTLDDVGGQIPIANNTLNFITGNIIGVNPQAAVYSAKIESALSCNSVGASTVLSSMRTIIKDDIPDGQTWDISPLGGTNLFSYNTVRAGTTNNIKWVASVQVISITQP